MLQKNQRNHFVIFFAILACSGLLLSSIAMTPYQAMTPTPESSISNTPLSTPTVTPTLTVTSTFTPTPSRTPTEGVPEAFQTEFASINTQLEGLRQDPAATHFANIFDNLVAAALVSLWTVLVGFANGFLKFKNSQDKLSGRKPNGTLINLEVLFGDIFKVSLWILFAVILILGISSLGQSIRESESNAELANISNKLDEILNQMPSSPAATTASNPAISPTEIEFSSPLPTKSKPDQTSEDIMMLLLTVEAMALGLMAFFVYFSSGLAKFQAEIYEVHVSNVNFREIGISLLPAGLVVFILFLLPSPVDGILMPLLVPFLIFGFFDVIRIYPSPYLKNLVVTHYSKIIYIAQFGAWYGFLSILKNYANPFFGVYESMWQKVIEKAITFSTGQWDALLYRLPRSVWDLAPLLLAMILAIRPWRRIRKQSEKNQIIKIRESMEQDDTSSSTGK